MKTHLILSAEDNEDDNILLQHAFRKIGSGVKLEFVNDGQAAIDYLQNLSGAQQPGEPSLLPDILLLDLKMPRKDGFAVLDWIRGQSFLRDMPVVVFTSSQDKEDIRRAYEKGAVSFLVKPVDLEGLVGLAGDLSAWVIGGDREPVAASPCYRAPIYQAY